MSESQKDIILKMLNEGAKPDAIAKEAESSVPMVYYMKAKFKKEGKLNYENR